MPCSWRNAGAGIVLLAALSALDAHGAEAAWQVTPRIEHSQVEVNGNGGTWDAWGVTVTRRDGTSGIGAALGRQERNGLADDELHLSASTRLGGWDASAALQRTVDPDFLPEWGYQVQVERGAGRHRRAGAGYRRLQFADSSVHLVSAHMTFHRGNDEYGIEYRLGRNAVLDHDIRVLQLRAAWLRGRNRVGAYLAHGDYLFDALGVRGAEGEGWSATLALARDVTPSTTVRWELGAGGEADSFRQRTMALSVQYRP